MPDHRPSNDVLAAHLVGEAVLLDLATKRYFRLNTTGAAIWRAMEAGQSRAEIIAMLLDRFDVDENVAAQAVDELTVDLTARGLLLQTPETLAVPADGGA